MAHLSFDKFLQPDLGIEGMIIFMSYMGTLDSSFAEKVLFEQVFCLAQITNDSGPYLLRYGILNC